MAKKAQLNKKVKREAEAKRLAQKKKTLIIVMIVLVLILAVAMGISAIRAAATDTYSDGMQTIRLLPGGKFTADLVHNEKQSGTYTRYLRDGEMVVTFMTEAGTFMVEMEDGYLPVPEEWRDDHGHNYVLPKR